VHLFGAVSSVPNSVHHAAVCVINIVHLYAI
jgi:hypothetical protein